MPKNSSEQIDVDEKKVIRELQRNSKESIDKIAKKCGFSRQKVWRIIKRLEKNKTIGPLKLDQRLHDGFLDRVFLGTGYQVKDYFTV